MMKRGMMKSGMMKRGIKKITAAGLAAAVCIAGFGGASAYAEEASNETWDDVITFEREEDIEKFACHFVSSQNERRSDEFDYSWELQNGAVRRTGNIDIYSDTINIAIMTYTGNVYSDFELSVDIRCGTKTSYWPVVGIRQQIPGKYYTTEGGGTGIFMQQNGKITLWGPITGGIIEKETPKSNTWYPSMWHNLRIVALGTVVTVYVDGDEMISSSVLSTDYVKGYISLQSVNNDCSFDNFKIRDLSEAAKKKNEENKSPFAHEGTPLDELVNN